MKRGLLLVTKVLQNLSNEILYVEEDSMFPLNGWISSKLPAVQSYFLKLVCFINLFILLLYLFYLFIILFILLLILL